jgi:predicted Holliday junction resolvase-like endonuclease
MKNNPLIVSLLIGLIVVLVIAGVSLLVKNKSLSEIYNKSFSKSIGLEKDIEDVRLENVALSKSVESLKAGNKELEEEYDKKIEELKNDNMRLEKLKEKLEDNLKDELMKQKLSEE